MSLTIHNTSKLFLHTENGLSSVLRSGSIFVLTVPFRVSSGKISQFKDAFRGHYSELWILNKVPVFDFNEQPFSNRPTISDRCSIVTIYIQDKKPKKESLKVVKKAFEEGQNPEFPNNLDLKFIAFSIFERFFITLTEISPGCISGPKGGFYEISINGFFEWLKLECRVLIEGSSTIREQDIWKISLGELRVRQGWSWSGGIENITETERKEIQSFLDTHLDKYFFHELRFRARQSAFRDDYRSALLWDVIALETLINLIYNNWFDNVVIQENKNIPNRANKLIDNIARDLGLTSMIQLISYVALPKEKQPSDEVIWKAVKAISVRNKITHSLRSNTGEYHSRIINNNELVEARKAIHELMEILINFVEGKGVRSTLLS